MHQLFAQNLHTETHLDVFFQKYLGADVLVELNKPLVDFSNWPLEAREALHALCIHFAEHIPAADHVIRRDVGTAGHCPPNVPGNLLMYFGIQFPTGGHRGQFIGISYEKEKNYVLNLFVAGSTDPKIIGSLNRDEDPDGILANNTIHNLKDFEKIKKSIIFINSTQLRIIFNRKSTLGFNPDFCWKRRLKAAKLNSQVAGNIYFKYYEKRMGSLSINEQKIEKDLMRENNYYRKNIAVVYIEEHTDVEEAYLLALNTHA